MEPELDPGLSAFRTLTSSNHSTQRNGSGSMTEHLHSLVLVMQSAIVLEEETETIDKCESNVFGFRIRVVLACGMSWETFPPLQVFGIVSEE